MKYLSEREVIIFLITLSPDFFSLDVFITLDLIFIFHLLFAFYSLFLLFLFSPEIYAVRQRAHLDFFRLTEAHIPPISFFSFPFLLDPNTICRTAHDFTEYILRCMQSIGRVFLSL